ncbi:hypothetical protein [Gallibacterium genomosp. 2]|nr:hypothetical protein [Gallibacterium genomosp. 2]
MMNVASHEICDTITVADFVDYCNCYNNELIAYQCSRHPDGR